MCETINRLQRQNSTSNADTTADPIIEPITDPIMLEILSNRQQMTDVSPEHELIRITRMKGMLQHSKRYKKRQVQIANENWLAELDEALNSPSAEYPEIKDTKDDKDTKETKRTIRVSFKQEPTIITYLPTEKYQKNQSYFNFPSLTKSG